MIYAKLLPPNASTLERALINAAPRAELDAAIPAIANVLHTQPDSFKPWLAAEWNLSQFARYFNNEAELINQGLPWLFERGSLAACLRALGWLGYAGARIEEDDNLIHLMPGQAEAALDLARISQVMTASLPAHSRFYRMVYGRDLRAAKTDSSRFDGALFDDDSGNWSGEPGLSVKLDFLITRTQACAAYRQPAASAAYRQANVKVVSDDLSLRFDSWVLDSVVVPLSIVSIAEVKTSLINPPNHHRNKPAHRAAKTAVLATALPQIKSVISRSTACQQITVMPRYGWRDKWRKGWAITYQRIETFRSV